jgi:hypothetical protein
MTRLAPDLQHHGPQRIADERVGCRAQRTLHVEGAHRHHQARIEAELGKPVHRQRTHFALAKIRGNPEERPPPQHPRGQAQHKSGRAGAVPATFGEHLMDRAQRKPALQRAIGLSMAKCCAIAAVSAIMRLKTLDAPAQSRKHAHACARHRAASLS